MKMASKTFQQMRMMSPLRMGRKQSSKRHRLSYMRKVEILPQTDFWGFKISSKQRDQGPLIEHKISINCTCTCLPRGFLVNFHNFGLFCGNLLQRFSCLSDSCSGLIIRLEWSQCCNQNGHSVVIRLLSTRPARCVPKM